MIFSSRHILQKTSGFYFTVMKPQVDLFLFVFWRKLKITKIHFEINWPLCIMFSSQWGKKKLNEYSRILGTQHCPKRHWTHSFIFQFDFFGDYQFCHSKKCMSKHRGLNYDSWKLISSTKECASTQAWLVYVGMTHLSSLIGQVWSNLLSYYITLGEISFGRALKGL